MVCLSSRVAGLRRQGSLPDWQSLCGLRPEPQPRRGPTGPTPWVQSGGSNLGYRLPYFTLHTPLLSSGEGASCPVKSVTAQQYAATSTVSGRVSITVPWTNSTTICCEARAWPLTARLAPRSAASSHGLWTPDSPLPRQTWSAGTEGCSSSAIATSAKCVTPPTVLRKRWLARLGAGSTLESLS